MHYRIAQPERQWALKLLAYYVNVIEYRIAAYNVGKLGLSKMADRMFRNSMSVEKARLRKVEEAIRDLKKNEWIRDSTLRHIKNAASLRMEVYGHHFNDRVYRNCVRRVTNMKRYIGRDMKCRELSAAINRMIRVR